MDRLGDSEGLREIDNDGEGLIDSETDELGVTEGLKDIDELPVSEGEALTDDDGLTDADGEGDIDRLGERLIDKLGDGLIEDEGLTEADGLGEILSDTEALGVGEAEDEAEAEKPLYIVLTSVADNSRLKNATSSMIVDEKSLANVPAPMVAASA